MSTNVRPANASKTNAMAIYHEKQRKIKEEKKAELETLRKEAVTVTRDGQEFRVVTIPDKYTWRRLDSND